MTDQIEETAHRADADSAITPLAAIYMLRTVQQHHIQLSVIADFKASILITAASILVTAFVALTSSVGIEPGIVVAAPLVLASLGFAIYAVLPKASTTGGPTPGSPGFNLFFFGHFSRMSQDEYIDAMMEVVGDSAQVYAHQIEDIYQLGSYLRAGSTGISATRTPTLFVGVALGVVVELIAIAI